MKRSNRVDPSFDDFTAQVAGVLAEARKAAKAAGQIFAKKHPRHMHGLVADCGWVWIEIKTSNRRLREALLKRQVLERCAAGGWRLEPHWTPRVQLPLGFKESGCSAALEVLKRRLGKSASFGLQTLQD